MLDEYKLAYPSVGGLRWSAAICGASVQVVLDDSLKQPDTRYACPDGALASELKAMCMADILLQGQAVEPWRQVFRWLMGWFLLASLIASVSLLTPFSGVCGVLTLPFYFCAAYAVLSIYDRWHFAVLLSEAVVAKLADVSASARRGEPESVRSLSLSARRGRSFDPL